MHKEQQWWVLFWALFWGIWICHNEWIFRGKWRSNEDIFLKAGRIVGEFDIAKQINTFPIRESTGRSRWKPPQPGILKLNVDAAKRTNSTYGVGAVLRDHTGDVLMTSCSSSTGGYGIEFIEALAVRHGLKTSLEAGFRCLEVETDNLIVAAALNRRDADASDFGTIIKDIKLLANSCETICFSHIKREGNAVAHFLASLSFNFEDCMYWLEDYPPEVADVISSDKFE